MCFQCSIPSFYRWFKREDQNDFYYWSSSCSTTYSRTCYPINNNHLIFSILPYCVVQSLGLSMVTDWKTHIKISFLSFIYKNILISFYYYLSVIKLNTKWVRVRAFVPHALPLFCSKKLSSFCAQSWPELAARPVSHTLLSVWNLHRLGYTPIIIRTPVLQSWILC